MTPPRLALVRLARPHPLRSALEPAAAAGAAPALGEDLRLFLTAWAGGLVFFGTLLA